MIHIFRYNCCQYQEHKNYEYLQWFDDFYYYFNDYKS